MNELLLTSLGIALAGWVIAIQLPSALVKHYTLVLDVSYFAGTTWLAFEVGGQALAMSALLAGVMFSAMLHTTKLFVRA